MDILDKKIQPAEYNCHYWKLMAQYMGVEPAAATNHTTYDMPYKFYEGLVSEFSTTR